METTMLTMTASVSGPSWGFRGAECHRVGWGLRASPWTVLEPEGEHLGCCGDNPPPTAIQATCGLPLPKHVSGG